MTFTELLPRYYEAHGKSMTYAPERIIEIEGHEIAWMRYDGHVIHDIMGRGREGESFTGHAAYCECYFTEFVGWRISLSGDKRFAGRSTGLMGREKCIYRKTAMHLRHLELRDEYKERFNDIWDSFSREHIKAIILDLIEKVKAEEFIGEDTNGASFYGGYFYLQTVAAITDRYIGHLWEPIYEMIEAKQIGLDGAVIQPYTEPPPPKWEEFARLEVDGWIGIASLPGHRKMAREWHFEVLKPDGEPAYGMIPGEPLDHDPIFGPDVDDVANAEKRLNELIAQVKP